MPLHDEAMALTAAGDPTLRLVRRELKPPGPGQLLLRVSVCGVCRTDLHLADGELRPTEWPRVPGHEVVGHVVALDDGCQRFSLGMRLGVAWLHDSCGVCRACEQQRENLCAHAHFTGMDVDGGYARHILAHEDFCFALPQRYSDEQAAPLLCAGMIGWRALRLVGQCSTLGLYGFGAAGHLIAQVALQQGRRVYAFTRPGDSAAQSLARSLGVQWAGGSDEEPPGTTDGAILFAPVGDLVPLALRQSVPGSTVVCAGIHMSDIPRFAYRLLWGERVVRSVANLTRQDGNEFLAWAQDHALTSTVEVFPLHRANEALRRLRDGRITGVAVLRCD